MSSIPSISAPQLPGPAPGPANENKQAVTTVPENLLDYLTRQRLNRKLIDIALAETKLPFNLKEEATQEILLSWHKAKALPQYSLSETASYAHLIAKTAALRIRRELGSALRLPGSAFHKRGRGPQHLTPGLLAAPVELSGIEETEEASPLGTIADIQPLQIQELYEHLEPAEAAVLGLLLEGHSIYKATLMLKLSKQAMRSHIASLVAVARSLGLYQE